jgi:hypothetical protein
MKDESRPGQIGNASLTWSCCVGGVSIPPVAAVAHLIDEIGGTLRLAGVLVAARRPVDLVGLEDTVGRLCAACLDLPPDLGRAQRLRLLALLAELDALAAPGEGAP